MGTVIFVQELFASSKKHIDQIWNLAKNLGGSLSEYAVWLLERSMKTLALRVRAQNDNAKQIAEWLTENPLVSQVFYPGLTSHPNHQLAKKQMNGFTGMLSFELEKSVNSKSF